MIECTVIAIAAATNRLVLQALCSAIAACGRVPLDVEPPCFAIGVAFATPDIAHGGGCHSASCSIIQGSQPLEPSANQLVALLVTVPAKTW